MYDDIAQSLTRLGLTEREATVYVALLQVGEATGHELAATVGIPRASTHDVLEHLSQMGLVTPYVEQEQKRFSAEPPERLLTMLHLQKREMLMREEYAERILPRLAAVHRWHDAKPRIRYIEGMTGLRNMQREYELQEGDVIQLVGYDAFLALEEKKVTQEHRALLQQKPRRVRSLLVTDRALPMAAPGHEIRRVSPALLEVMGEVTVWGDRVLLLSYAGGLIAVEVASPAIATAVRGALELAWKASESFMT